MRWITREKVKVDRVACPWLIKRFIDARAEFIFVPADAVASTARELDATPFDIPGCELGHHGEDVSFDSFLKKYSLTHPALALLGEIVRAADSHPTNPHPAGEGLRWIAHGFSALGLSDDEILQREFILYDALYAECQRRLQKRSNDVQSPADPSVHTRAACNSPHATTV
ncbi:MAG: chromate resistance protein [Verrucomicrobia bacterium]|nr:chromate resistance protein [Verrucomicrobiota bacterium]